MGSVFGQLDPLPTPQPLACMSLEFKKDSWDPQVWGRSKSCKHNFKGHANQSLQRHCHPKNILVETTSAQS